MVRRLLPIALLVVGAVALTFYLGSVFTRPPNTPAPVSGSDVVFTLSFGVFLPLGAFIASTRPRNPIGWLMAVIGLSTLVGTATSEYATRALLVDPGSLPAGPEAAFVASILLIPGIALMTFLMLLFPNGTLLSARWRWVGRIAAANMALYVLILTSLWPFRGPVLLRDEPPGGAFVPAFVFNLCWFLLMLSAVAGLVSLVVRFRRSSGVERQQLKWMAYVAGLVGSFVLLNFFVLEPLGVTDPTVTLVGELVLNLGVAGVPIAAAIAIARYRLYDIDVVINRTLVYGALTAILVGTYLGLVFGFQAVLAPVTSESDLAVAASTLAVAGLFRPVRTRVQRFIDHRFYRRKFDTQRTLEDFSSQLRDEVDLAALSAQLTRVVAETMQPAHVSLWIRGPSRLDPVTISER